MRRLLASAAAVLAAAVPAATVLAAPAHAQWWSAPDASGDVEGVEAPMSELAEDCVDWTEIDGAHRRDLDITRLAVRHGRRDVVVTVHLGDVVPRRLSDLEVPLLTPRADYTVVVELGRRGAFVDWVPGLQSSIAEQVARDPDRCWVSWNTTGEGCAGLRADRSQRLDQVRVTVPRACLGNPRAVRVGAQTSGPGDLSETEAEETLRGFHDRWAPDGRAQDGWFATYGPWVRAAR